jgi:hypothetical protein
MGMLIATALVFVEKITTKTDKSSKEPNFKWFHHKLGY